MFSEKLVNLLTLLGLLLAAVVAQFAEQAFYIDLLSRIVILALAGVGLNLALGYGGLVSFGHAAFFGLGGYVVGIGGFHAFEETLFLTWPWDIAGSEQMLTLWALVLFLSALLALVIGSLSLRTHGVYFIMITLAFAQMVYYFAISWPTYGGEDGLSLYQRGLLFGLDTEDPITFFGICFVLLLAALGFSRQVMRSRFGAALECARMNATRLATAGIDPQPIQLTAFVISAMITALAGALYADLNAFVDPSMLDWHRSGEIMVLIILGGVGRLMGPVLGALVFVLLEDNLGGWTDRWQFFLGVILLSVVLFARGGLMGLLTGRAQDD